MCVNRPGVLEGHWKIGKLGVVIPIPKKKGWGNAPTTVAFKYFEWCSRVTRGRARLIQGMVKRKANAVLRDLFRTMVTNTTMHSVFKSVFVPILTHGQECWVMTERVLSQVKSAEGRIFAKRRSVLECAALKFMKTWMSTTPASRPRGKAGVKKNEWKVNREVRIISNYRSMNLIIIYEVPQNNVRLSCDVFRLVLTACSDCRIACDVSHLRAISSKSNPTRDSVWFITLNYLLWYSLRNKLCWLMIFMNTVQWPVNSLVVYYVYFLCCRHSSKQWNSVIAIDISGIALLSFHLCYEEAARVAKIKHSYFVMRSTLW